MTPLISTHSPFWQSSLALPSSISPFFPSRSLPFYILSSGSFSVKCLHFTLTVFLFIRWATDFWFPLISFLKVRIAIVRTFTFSTNLCSFYGRTDLHVRLYYLAFNCSSLFIILFGTEIKLRFTKGNTVLLYSPLLFNHFFSTRFSLSCFLSSFSQTLTLLTPKLATFLWCSNRPFTSREV